MEPTQLDRIEAKLDQLLAKPAPRSASAPISEGAIATDADLDGQYGDEVLKYGLGEKWWKGEDFAGKPMSQCSADYLDAVAKANDAQAHMKMKSGDPEEIKKAGFKSRTAARARGWAARVRAGKVKRVESPSHDMTSDEIPF